MPKRIINLSVLPGEPLDGSGRVCIHLYVRDPRGPFVEPHVLHPGQKKGELVARPTRGRLACDPKRKVAPVTRNGITTVTVRTEEAQAVTCPRCIASPEWKAMMERLEKLQTPPEQGR